MVWSPQKIMGRDVKVFRMRTFLVLSLVPSPCDDNLISTLHQVIQHWCAVDDPSVSSGDTDIDFGAWIPLD